MNNRIRIAGALCVGVLTVTACGSSNSSKAATVTTKPKVTATTKPTVTATTKPKVTATTKPAVTATTKPAVTATTKPKVTATTKPKVTATTKPAVTATTKPTVTAAGTGSAAVDLGTTTLGKVLTDGKGMTLYAFEKDTKGKSSACDATCAKTWMPDEVTGKPTAGTGVESAKLGTITRSDGTTQVTYNGWPLYHYSGDSKAGEVKGEKVQSTWYAVNASGSTV